MRVVGSGAWAEECPIGDDGGREAHDGAGAAPAESLHPLDFAAKPLVLDRLRVQAGAFFDLIRPDRVWEEPTAAGHWEVRDLAAQMVAVTTRHLACLTAPASTRHVELPRLEGHARRTDEAVMAARTVSRVDTLAALGDRFAVVTALLDSLDETMWTRPVVAHPVFGRVPGVFCAAHLILASTVYAWDIREGRRQRHAVSADAADMVSPFLPKIWQLTLKAAPARPIRVGVQVSGRNGAGYLVHVDRADGFRCTMGDAWSAPTVLEFDPGSFLLTVYGRINGGCDYGDLTQARRFRNLFFRI
ncbi:hypothetical protein HNR23_001254 [Nocardiopsis mwathae]|uniref:Mycothiol-dependent maleylpyruvate isomerase metal-binding domain-containing protein n=1 Tax=Nocardiopsis mwathae TaxID=1472723 RepID=A0A7W9YFM5_9ACTN|nr:hypothetical protein [Nocardiopsis mwathae]MBB6171194.1 hypothetical protein [Nocardiopsis mwathae]